MLQTDGKKHGLRPQGWIFVLLLALLLCFVSGGQAEAVEFNGRNMEEFLAYMETHDMGTRVIAEDQKDRIEDRIPEAERIRLGTGDDGQENFFAPQDDVAVLRKGEGGLEIIQTAHAGPGTGAAFTLGSVPDALAGKLTAGRRVCVITGENSYDFGMVASYSGGQLKLKAPDEVKESLFAYTKGLSISGSHTFNISCEKMNLPNGFGTFEIPKGTVTITARVDCGLVPCYLDVKFKAQLNIGEMVLHIDTPELELAIPLIKAAEVPIIPGLLAISFSPEAVLSAKASGTVNFGLQMQEGFYFYHKVHVFEKDEEWKGSYHEKPTFTMNSAEVEGEVFVGLAWGPHLEIAEGLATAGIDYKGGAVFEGWTGSGRFRPEDIRKRIWHACGDFECFQLKGFPRLGPISMYIKFGGSRKNINDFTEPTDFDPFLYGYWSRTFGDKSLNYLCPHKGYKLRVKVTDRSGRMLEDAKISYAPYEDEFKEVAADIGYSREQECYPLYIPRSNPSAVPSEDGNPVEVSMTITVDGKTYNDKKAVLEKGMSNQEEGEKDTDPDPKELVFVVDADRFLTFDPNLDALPNIKRNEVHNIPGRISYYPGEGRTVQIPENQPRVVPIKSNINITFDGWNTRPDGSGEQYYALDRIPAEAFDQVLYAQWKPAEATGGYRIYFSANGGSGAPGKMATRYEQDNCTLPEKKPVWEGHTFLGWSKLSTAFEAEFQPGETVAHAVLNPNQYEYIYLYAVWSMSPVDMPYRLTYNMNGGPEDQRPPDQWARKHAYVQVSDAHPVWNELYSFTGWSTDPNAGEGRIAPGSMIYIAGDKTLYAIWRMNPAPLPNMITFEDTGDKTAENMPGPVYFSHAEGVEVNLPDTVPTKQDSVFTGWCTTADGKGERYMPGTRIRPKGSMTLYACWFEMQDKYVILYNPNGGTYAPAPQTAHYDEIAILSSEAAVWDTHKFLGWALTEDASTAEYPYGEKNAFINKDGARNVTLYAVWGFDPVSMPCRLTYDMNGGPKEQMPAAQWAKAGSWLQVSSRIPVWNEQNAFAGWSTDPKAQWGEYDPGTGLKIEEDMTLYAIWAPMVRVTYDLNGGWSGLPESHMVHQGIPAALSTQEPSWDAQHRFLGWSPKKDDTKAMYPAGGKARFLTDTTLYAIWEAKYRIIEGNGSEWQPGSGTGLRFAADGNIRYFHALLIDGNIVRPDSYSLSEGSTVAVLTETYLKTLQAGQHTIRFRYHDGYADGVFTVLAKPVPRTGDPGDLILWLGLILAGIAGIGGMTAAQKKRKNQDK